MRAHRFFLPPESFKGDRVAFPAEIAHQIRRVLRLRTGETVIALDGTGSECVVRLEVNAGNVGGTVQARRRNAAEPDVSLTLYIGILKAHKLELVLQKCTEVGVSYFVPVVTERSVAQEPSAGRQRRFEAIVREAAEQSGRGTLPAVDEPRSYRGALAEAAAGGPVYMLWEKERDTGVRSIALGPVRASVFVGPEGGFTEQEAAEARASGGVLLSIGPRILRAETAAIVGSALVLARLEED